MNRTEYDSWVDYAVENYSFCSRIMVADYHDWKQRSLLGRTLLRLEQYEPAIEILKSVVSMPVPAEPEEYDAGTLSDFENYVWCMWELSQAIANSGGKLEQALCHSAKAVKLCEAAQVKFSIIEPVLVWLDNLGVLREMGRTEEALAKADAKLHGLQQRNDEASSSFKAAACVFQSETAYLNNDFDKALRFLVPAVDTLFGSGKKDPVIEKWKQSDEKKEQIYRMLPRMLNGVGILFDDKLYRDLQTL